MYRDLLLRFTEICKEILEDNLIGVYLHGSMAMGCFHPAKSDLDLIVVVEDNIPDEKKMRFMEQVVRLNEEAPAKGIEMSIVRRKYCKPFVYPTPFELHFSVTHLKWFHENPKEYIEKMNGTDKDLAAHFMIMNHYGIALYGAEVKSVFGEVPKADYMDSIWYDIRDAREDILSNPMYIILNLCRVSGYLKDNLILSKQTGGEWGLKNLDLKYRRLIQDALDCYETERTMEAEKEKAAEFAEYMIQDIKKHIKK